MKRPVAVIGLGNPLMSDEGIGIHVVQRLSGLSEKYPSVDFIDAGTGGVSVLHIIEGRQKAIFIDCARMAEQPGVIKRFKLEDVKSNKVLTGRSLHEADLVKVLEMAARLGQSPGEVVIFGIEPQRVSAGMGLSETLSEKIDYYVSVICEEFR
jgi:hydrogenase maturation protease